MCRVEIRIQACIDESWSEWFDGFEISHPAQGETVLTGTVPDQAALYGLIAKLRDLGLPLHSINQLEQEPASVTADAPDSSPFDRL